MTDIFAKAKDMAWTNREHFFSRYRALIKEETRGSSSRAETLLTSIVQIMQRTGRYGKFTYEQPTHTRPNRSRKMKKNNIHSEMRQMK